MNLGGRIVYPLHGDAQVVIGELLMRFEERLLKEGATNVSTHGDILTFSWRSYNLYYWFALSARFLDIIDKGFIRVVTERGRLLVVYRFSFLRSFVVWLLPSGLIFLIFITGDVNLFAIFWASLKVLTIIFGAALVQAFISFYLFAGSVCREMYRELQIQNP
ncbi:MAG TPA: hypothetical protein VHM28_07120 [Anaerolineales bacterium]|jgi:hypothetical protein|nr:hypothetical protein [Anaerolineales bacterium]